MRLIVASLLVFGGAEAMAAKAVCVAQARAAHTKSTVETRVRGAENFRPEVKRNCQLALQECRDKARRPRNCKTTLAAVKYPALENRGNIGQRGPSGIVGSLFAWDPGNMASGNTLSQSGMMMRTSLSGTGGGKAGFGMKSGKWYFEIQTTGGWNTANYAIGGLCSSSKNNDAFYGNGVFMYSGYSNGGKINTSVDYSYASVGAGMGSTIGVAVDMDRGQVSFIINGVDQGIAFRNLPSVVYPCAQDPSSGASYNQLLRVTTNSFSYRAPRGFKAPGDFQ